MFLPCLTPLLFTRTYARCDRKPYSCVAVIHELPQMRVMFCVSPDQFGKRMQHMNSIRPLPNPPRDRGGCR